LNSRTLWHRNLVFHRRAHLATALAVATAATVLTGALLVGDSMRGSLRDLAIGRLGRVDHALVAGRFIREVLASEIACDWRFEARFTQACPVLLLRGSIHRADSDARSSGINVLGVDDRFWRLSAKGTVPFTEPQFQEPASAPGGHRPNGETLNGTVPLSFHGQDARATARRVILNEPLARELNARVGDDVLVHVAGLGNVPSETLFGRRDAASVSLRLTVGAVVSAEDLGGFTLKTTQAQPRNAFVPLGTLQRSLKCPGRCNTILIAGRQGARRSSSEDIDRLGHLLAEKVSLEDLGLKLRREDGRGCVVLESRSFLLAPSAERAAIAAARVMDASCGPVLAYLANTIAVEPSATAASQTSRPATISTTPVRAREIPYSTVAAIDLPTGTPTTSLAFEGGTSKPVLGGDGILLNDWAAGDLGARIGDRIHLTYYLPGPFGGLQTQVATFVLRGILRMQGLAADRGLVPEYEGVTDAKDLKDWNPPFPVDLGRIRPRDEEYWHKYGPTPKAFVSLKAGQELWTRADDRFGRLTSIRVGPVRGKDLEETAEEFEWELRCRLTPRETGLAFEPVKSQALSASQGSTDFAMLFLGFSLFLIVSAVLLVVLLFRLGIERRSPEIGLLLASGFSRRRVTGLLVAEGALLVVVGTAVGLLGAMGYAWLMLAGLRSWWSAVNAPFLSLHITPASFILGSAISLIVGWASIAWAVRGVSRAAPRLLLAGGAAEHFGVAPTPHRRFPLIVAVAAVCISVGLTPLALATDRIDRSSAFFGSGAAMLVACLAGLTVWVRNPRRRPIAFRGLAPIARLGARNAARYPRRSLLTVGIIASATFILAVVAANRQVAGPEVRDRRSGTGGFSLMVESTVPILYDLNTLDGRKALRLSSSTIDALSRATVVPFRVRSGDDASCVNLYQTNRPRILGATEAMIRRGGFTFSSFAAKALSSSKQRSQQNPWTLLDCDLPGGAIPAIGDENTVMWLLHLGIDQEYTMTDDAGRPIRLRIVGMLAGSVLQGELIVAESRFKKAFPSVGGYNFFLVDAPIGYADRLKKVLESELDNEGLSVVRTADRLSEYLAVENMYLATFQMLGGLGMVLGTLGLAAVVLRGVFERRGELALMRALGYRRLSIGWMVMAENSVLLLAGLGTGVISAAVALVPQVLSRPMVIPWASLGLTLGAVAITGGIAGFTGLVATVRQPLLESLRTE
jgi:putative ABC transport system permease protein